MLQCNVIDVFLNKQPDALIIQIYSVIKLYMFRASSLPVIRSFPLYIRHRFDDSCQALPEWLCMITVIKPHYRDHHHRLPPWIRSLYPFRHRRVAIVSWGVHDHFFLEVFSWGRVSDVWCCPFFQDGWSCFVCIWISRLIFQRSLVLFLWLRFLFWSSKNGDFANGLVTLPSKI